MHPATVVRACAIQPTVHAMETMISFEHTLHVHSTTTQRQRLGRRTRALPITDRGSRDSQANHECAPLTLGKTHAAAAARGLSRTAISSCGCLVSVLAITITAAVPNHHVPDVSLRRVGNVSREAKPEHTLHNKDSFFLNPRISDQIGIASN